MRNLTKSIERDIQRYDRTRQMIDSMKAAQGDIAPLTLEMVQSIKESEGYRVSLHHRITYLEELLRYVRESVTCEVAAYGSCDCNLNDVDAGPCPFCAANHFNERTMEFSPTGPIDNSRAHMPEKT